jgi:hypothetical protein
MRPLLKRLFPTLYPRMSEWTWVKWVLFPLAMILVVNGMSGIVHVALYGAGYIGNHSIPWEPQ